MYAGWPAIQSIKSCCSTPVFHFTVTTVSNETPLKKHCVYCPARNFLPCSCHSNNIHQRVGKGVPEESLLATLLFSPSINDLKREVDYGCLLFADDPHKISQNCPSIWRITAVAQSPSPDSLLRQMGTRPKPKWIQIDHDHSQESVQTMYVSTWSTPRNSSTWRDSRSWYHYWYQADFRPLVWAVLLEGQTEVLDYYFCYSKSRPKQVAESLTEQVPRTSLSSGCYHTTSTHTTLF